MISTYPRLNITEPYIKVNKINCNPYCLKKDTCSYIKQTDVTCTTFCLCLIYLLRCFYLPAKNTLVSFCTNNMIIVILLKPEHENEE